VPSPERSGPLRSRVTRLRATHSYRFVLLLIGVTFVFASLAGDDPWTTSVLLLLEAATLAAAVWTSGLARGDSKLLHGLLVAALLVAVAVVFSSPTAFEAAVGIVAIVLVVATIVAIAIGVVDQAEVNAQSVTGAICMYLLFGIVFMFLYSVAAEVGSGDFFAQGTDGTRAVRLYFSFVTLATLGYGDYTAAGDFGHILAVLETIFGQLYLVTVLALLVSRLQGRRIR
jgi:Ion channel